MVEDQLEGDRGSGRVSGDMRPTDTQVVEQRSGVGRVVRACTSGLAAPVIPDQSVAIDQRRLE